MSKQQQTLAVRVAVGIYIFVLGVTVVESAWKACGYVVWFGFAVGLPWFLDWTAKSWGDW
jgi:hypothetical protein